MLSSAWIPSYRWVALAFCLCTTAGAAQIDPQPVNESIRTFMYSEQVQSEGNGVLTQPQNVPGKMVRAIPGLRAFENYGALPPSYIPSAQTEHRLITLLIPEQKAPELVRSAQGNAPFWEHMLHVERNGVRYVRFFILPLPQNIALYRQEIREYPHDNLHWVGLQQSSGRTITVLNVEGLFHPVSVKMDLNIMMAGSPRTLNSRQVNTAPRITDMVELAKHSSSSKEWDYMPEPVAVGGPGDKGGNIYRAFPPELITNEATMIPLFALVNGRRDGLWLDTLATAEGMTRQQFLRDKLTPMMIDTFAELALDNGLVPEMHQQNVLLMIDNKTHRLRKIVLRDMDAFQVNPLVRENLGLDNSRIGELTAGQLKGNRLGKFTAGGLRYRYAFQYRFNYDWLLRGSFLKGVNTKEIMKAGDQRLLEHANRLLGGRVRLDSVKNLDRFPTLLSQASTRGSSLKRIDAVQEKLKKEFQAITSSGKAYTDGAYNTVKVWYSDQRDRVLAIGQKGEILGVAFHSTSCVDQILQKLDILLEAPH